MYLALGNLIPTVYFVFYFFSFFKSIFTFLEFKYFWCNFLFCYCSLVWFLFLVPSYFFAVPILFSVSVATKYGADVIFTKNKVEITATRGKYNKERKTHVFIKKKYENRKKIIINKILSRTGRTAYINWSPSRLRLKEINKNGRLYLFEQRTRQKGQGQN